MVLSKIANKIAGLVWGPIECASYLIAYKLNSKVELKLNDIERRVSALEENKK